jgi:hypothetical protein
MARDLRRLINDVKEARADFEARLDESDAAKEHYYESVRRLYKAGMPLREIAEAVGVSHQRVHQIVGDESAGARVRRAVAKRARAGGVGVFLLLVGAWWGAANSPQQSRADAIAGLEGAREFMSSHLPDDAQEFILRRLDEMTEH